jgi:solute carrier family 25 protein 38
MSDGLKKSAQDVARTQRKPHPTFHFVAGLASGLSTSILLQPADLLKTRVQQSRSSLLLPVLRSILASPHPIASLWRGTTPSAIRTGFGSALYFSSLSALRQAVANNQAKKVGTASLSVADGITNSGSSVLPKLSNTQNLATGAVARVCAGFVMMPVTVIKVRYESDIYAYKSMLSASRDILRLEGARGFFSGFGATAIRDAPYAGLYVVFYEWSKKKFNTAFQSSSAISAAGINFTSGALAAGLATSITNPFDAVKTRLQLMPRKYGNMLKATRTMLQEDGLRSFFDGLGLRMSRKAISSALAWTVYEELIGRAERHFAEEQRVTSAL